ncbi:MAG TPA: fumarylacetoacetate hydrolase family protein [Usitatibacter sp.]|nr:fumarylacetoacetate hydrolase family protein [Usitatibacter sp.]
MLAAALIASRTDSKPVRWAPELAPGTVEDAYRVQRDVLRALDGERRPVAWKVSPPKPGAPPQASPVPLAGLHRSPAVLVPQGIVLGIECEVAFRLGRNGAVSEAFALIELCTTRYADWSAADALSRLADFQSHGAFVLGSGTPAWQRDYAGQRVELRIEGKVVKSTVGGHPTGDLEGMLAWAVDHCASRGWALEPGDIVTMGSWTGIAPLAPGETATATFPGIGEARLTLGS